MRDLTGVAFIVCVTALVILFGGDPDLSDAIIQRLMR